MHPELIKIPFPEFLHGFLPEYLIIYSYGALIFTGTIMAFLFLKNRSAKELGLSGEDIQGLIVGLIIASIVGGKVFLFFENPAYYGKNPGALFGNSGFVFYGSLIFALFVVWYFIRKHKLNAWRFLDLIAFTTLIVHFFGRLGCFTAGCCHGLPTDSWMGVVFTDPHSQAEPLNTPLYPTQLFSAAMLFSIFLILWVIDRHKKFNGQIFLLYIMLYAIGRSIIEEFRGDEARGFVFDGFLSHSQLIAGIMFLVALVFYIRKLGQNR